MATWSLRLESGTPSSWLKAVMHSHEFSCAVCGRPASTVWLVPTGVKDPRLEAASDLLVDQMRVSIAGGPMSVTIAPVSEESARRLEAALDRGDAATIYDIDPEFAPFWCPTCAASYCRDHWVTETVFDGEFYDCTKGTCPQGHTRVLSD